MNPGQAYDKALELRRQDSELEEVIKQSPCWAYCYARDVIKDRWPEAEETIKQDAYCAYRYALDVIKGRWLEAEEIIKQSPQWASAYCFCFEITEDQMGYKPFMEVGK